ncbi:hypothetical protein ARMGADRAFT_772699 [Armillaria gallica]|uniref:Uncharacterized protein n=1 Tax=Armillaria gallica TaxID=47427 RepID=A0A2H3CIL4_ARMGA|nr:hypothetical protein ARMGADRAFT_772699 [Armillaria gallica]
MMISSHQIYGRLYRETYLFSSSAWALSLTSILLSFVVVVLAESNSVLHQPQLSEQDMHKPARHHSDGKNCRLS